MAGCAYFSISFIEFDITRASAIYFGVIDSVKLISATNTLILVTSVALPTIIN